MLATANYYFLQQERCLFVCLLVWTNNFSIQMLCHLLFFYLDRELLDFLLQLFDPGLSLSDLLHQLLDQSVVLRRLTAQLLSRAPLGLLALYVLLLAESFKHLLHLSLLLLPEVKGQTMWLKTWAEDPSFCRLWLILTHKCDVKSLIIYFLVCVARTEFWS